MTPTAQKLAQTAVATLLNLPPEDVAFLLQEAAPPEALAQVSTLVASLPRTSEEDAASGGGVATYSGLAPRIYLSAALSEDAEVGTLARALWVLAASLYLSTEGDSADLSAWLSEGLPHRLISVEPDTLHSLTASASSYPVLLSDTGNGRALAAVAAFTPLLTESLVS
jgi:hypothetical protein